MSNSAVTNDVLAQEFVQFSLDCGVLKFGEFKTKAGRLSPYFFNAGLFDDGAKLGKLASFYAQCIVNSGIEFDMICVLAYKGIFTMPRKKATRAWAFTHAMNRAM